MRLQRYHSLLNTWYAKLALATLLLVVAMLLRAFAPWEQVIMLVYALLYLVASPTAILVNKILMKDYGFGYPIIGITKLREREMDS